MTSKLMMKRMMKMQWLEYLQELRELRRDGFKVDKEIADTLAVVHSNFGFGKTSKSDYEYLQREARRHPLITAVPGEFPCIKGTKIPVRDILNALARGQTVHQLCGEYNLDINQVSGAVIYAAYLVTPPTKQEIHVKLGGKVRVSYENGCSDPNHTDCKCGVDGGAYELDGPVTVTMSPLNQ